MEFDRESKLRPLDRKSYAKRVGQLGHHAVGIGLFYSRLRLRVKMYEIIIAAWRWSVLHSLQRFQSFLQMFHSMLQFRIFFFFSL